MRTSDSSRAIVISNGRLAMIHRRKNGKEYFVVPGGGVEDYETIEEAVKRELWEETSLKLTKSKPWFGGDYWGGHIYYFLCEAEGEKLELLGEEKERNTKDNWYRPEWVDLSMLKELTVYPENLVEKLVEGKFLVK